MMRVRSLLAPMCILFFASSVAMAQSTSTTAPKPTNASGTTTPTYALKYKLRPGEKIYCKVVHFAETRTKMSDHEETSSSRTTSEKVWEVKSVDADGNMTFEYRINSVDLAQRRGDAAEIHYSSDSEQPAPDIFKPVAETIGKPIATITIDPRGEVKTRDKEMKTPPLGMGEITIPLPAGPVAIGAEWSVPREMRVKLDNGTQKTFKVRELYTLMKVSAGVATIRVESQPLTPLNDPGAESQLIQQLSNGHIKFDLDQGRMLSKQLDWSEEVIGFRGPNSLLKYDARLTEELIPESQRTAAAKSKNRLK
jgi:hypothetical protein